MTIDLNLYNVDGTVNNPGIGNATSCRSFVPRKSHVTHVVCRCPFGHAVGACKHVPPSSNVDVVYDSPYHVHIDLDTKQVSIIAYGHWYLADMNDHCFEKLILMRSKPEIIIDHPYCMIKADGLEVAAYLTEV